VQRSFLSKRSFTADGDKENLEAILALLGMEESIFTIFLRPERFLQPPELKKLCK
jgi:hypothetical protein